MKRFACRLILLAGLVGALSASAQGRLNRSGIMRGGRGGAMAARQGANGGAAAGATDAKPALATREELKNVPKGTNGVPALAFNETPVELVLEAYAEQVQRTVIPAPDLPKATITLRSLEGQILTKEEYLFAIEHVLTMNGVVLEERGTKFLRALPRKTVRTQGIKLRMEARGLLPEQGRVVSQMISFQNIAVAEAQKALEGFKDPSGLFQVFERTNAILVTDTQENVNRMLEIAKAIDIATPVLEDVFVRQIKFAVATDIKTALETIVTESQKEAQAKEVGPKSSGAPGFAARNTPSTGSRLLNLNNRPGMRSQPEAPKANETMLAAIDDAARGMIRGKVLILADERSNKLIVITMKSNMDFFDKVIETLDVETEPEFKVEVVRLKYAEAEDVESMLNDLIGGTSSSSSKENKNQNAKSAVNTKQNITQGGAKTGAAAGKGNVHQGSVGDLNKENCKVLADKRINGIVVMTRKELMPVIMRVIDDMDVKLSQVLLETVIIQVELGDQLNTGIDWIRGGKKSVQTPNGTYYQRQKSGSAGWTESTSTQNDDGTDTGKNANGVTLTKGSDGKWYEPVYEWVEGTSTTHTRDWTSFNNGNGALNGGGGSASTVLGNLVGAAVSNGVDAAASNGAFPISSGVNYFFKSEKLNIAAVIQASKGDSRTKVLASPILMTVDNKEASIEATDMIYLFAGYQYSGSTYSGSQVRNYEKRDIGLTVKVTPKINPNGTVMLTIEETIESQGADQPVPNDNGGTDNYATVTTRKMSSDISVENRQTICMGGLTKTTKSHSETGVPILKDIPYIGKWLFGTVSDDDKRSEMLVFITPYVLDDAEAAQAEALRRKRALSDSRPWDDNGWSSSPLADPVSKREQLRRFQDEWAKQDEERKSKLAIEKAKVDRAKKLKNLSKEEREFWIKLHKEELEEDEKEAFDKQVKEREEQKDLKAFVEQLQRKDLAEAEKEIKAAERLDTKSNEYTKELNRLRKEGKELPAGDTLRRDAKRIAEEEKQKAAEAKAEEEKQKTREAKEKEAQAKDGGAKDGNVAKEGAVKP